MLGGSPEFSSDSRLQNHEIYTFSPSRLFTEAIRARRRNLYASIFISICFMVITTTYKDIKLSSVLIFKFSNDLPLSDLIVIKQLLAAHLIYVLISFLIELYSEMKQRNISFQNVNLDLEIEGKQNGGTHHHLILEPGSTNVSFAPDNYQKNMDNDGLIYLKIAKSYSAQASKLFLDKSSIAQDAIELFKLEKKIGNDLQLSSRKLNGDASEAHLNFVTLLRSRYRSFVLNLYTKHVYSSFVWWYEVLLPILIAIILVVSLYVP